MDFKLSGKLWQYLVDRGIPEELEGRTGISATYKKVLTGTTKKHGLNTSVVIKLKPDDVQPMLSLLDMASADLFFMGEANRAMSDAFDKVADQLRKKKKSRT